MKSSFEKNQPPEISGQLPSQGVQLDKYEDQRNRFLKDRLRILYLLAIFGNPSMLLVDYSYKVING